MSGRLKSAALTGLALTAFAGNSILCRLALRSGDIDPASFTSIRIGSGALVLALLVRSRGAGTATRPVSWRSAAALALYAVPFAFAYVTLSAGTGALLLFGAVQVTMLASSLQGGERPRATQWLGAAIALLGLVYLLLPGLTAPPLAGALLMLLAGMAWGIYSVLGRGSPDPLAETATNFARALPLALLATLVTLAAATATPRGLILALASGGLASGLGYVVWYAALRRITRLTASLVQLLVPVIAALAGVALLGEELTGRLLVAGVMVLGGIAMGVLADGTMLTRFRTALQSRRTPPAPPSPSA